MFCGAVLGCRRLMVTRLNVKAGRVLRLPGFDDDGYDGGEHINRGLRPRAADRRLRPQHRRVARPWARRQGGGAGARRKVLVLHRKRCFESQLWRKPASPHVQKLLLGCLL